MLDLTSTRWCPAGPVCRVCGAGGGLHVVTARVLVGVLCVTVCPACAPVPVPAEAGLVALVVAHCQHLRIGLDTMVAALARAT